MKKAIIAIFVVLAAICGKIIRQSQKMAKEVSPYMIRQVPRVISSTEWQNNNTMGNGMQTIPEDFRQVLPNNQNFNKFEQPKQNSNNLDKTEFSDALLNE